MTFDYRQAGLRQDEYRAIQDRIGRTPTEEELRILGVMWSEHCSYKSTRSLLSTFPVRGDHVLQGPGENAGVVDIGDGLGAAFKVESHNHPSAVAPYQGAATGVGGIIRDVLAMGARPVASMDGLCFGDPDSRSVQLLADGIIRGVGGYGNAVGVPTVGGKTIWDESYTGNPLVNAMCVGLVPLDEIVSSKTARPGHIAVLVGSATGRDGIAGAAFASAELSENTSKNRPQVQIGDPFVEKLLIECCLELQRDGLIVSMQDMGAAGIVSSSSEIAAKSGVGIVIDADSVPLREKDMNLWEIALSESQERMLLIIEPPDLEKVAEKARKWDLECAAIGKVTEDGYFRMSAGGETPVNLPADMVGGGSPEIKWPSAKPEATEDSGETLPAHPPLPHNLNDLVLRMTASPRFCDRSWVFKQYDHMVQTNTVVPPGNPVSVLRIRGRDTLLAITMDTHPWYCSLDPAEGGSETLLRALRPQWVAGAEPLGMTDCLNFPSPENPRNFRVLSECVRGLARAASDMDCPVVSGNVSLYNESPRGGILPTPLVGVVGSITDQASLLRSGTTQAGDIVFVVGNDRNGLAASGYMLEAHHRLSGKPPAYDPERERYFRRNAMATATEGAARSGRAVACGGLLMTLVRECVASGTGMHLDAMPSGDLERVLFGEGDAAAVYAVPQHMEKRFCEIWADYPVTRLGSACGERLVMGDFLDLSTGSLVEAWKG